MEYSTFTYDVPIKTGASLYAIAYSYVKLPEGNRDIVRQNQPTISNMVDYYGVAQFVMGF